MMSFHGEHFPRRSDNAQLVLDVYTRIGSMQGFTLPLNGGFVPASGWVVSLRDNETIYEGAPSLARLSLDILGKLRTQQNYPLFLGGWYDKGKYYLDVSRIISDYSEAVNFAKENDQLAIYNIGTGETVYLTKVVA